MARIKHDWLKYKYDYFESDIDEIIQFFDNYSTVVPKNTFQRKTQGWKEEKLAYKQKINQKILEKNTEKISDDVELQQLNEQLKQAKRNIIKKVANLLVGKDSKVTVNDLFKVKVGWEMIKTELGEATTISNQKHSGDKDNPVALELSEDIKYFLDALKK